eukprot:5954435-Prorocentrum_lima.AAC.1
MGEGGPTGTWETSARLAGRCVRACSPALSTTLCDDGAAWRCIAGSVAASLSWIMAKTGSGS